MLSYVSIRRTAVLAMIVGVSTVAGGNMSARAQCSGCQHGGHASDQISDSAGHQHEKHGDAARLPGGIAAAPAPHGGQMTEVTPASFEVVYQPREIRVYVYGSERQPQTARGVQGEVVLQVGNHSAARRVPLRYVASPAQAHEQDYLVAAVDVSRIKDGDMAVTFNLKGLPLDDQPQATFTQTFALTATKLRVTVVPLTEGDRAQIAKQQFCPVMGAKLGSMGAPTKVLIGEQAVYLCCKGCLGKVEKSPEQYLAKATQSHSGH